MMDFDRTAANDATDNQWQRPDAELTPEELVARAAQAAAAPPVVGAGAMRVVPGPDGVVVLPEGVSLDQIRVSGRDLVVQLPDGTQMLIVDGAVIVPQLVIGGVEIPPLNLAALLIGNEPQPAAGGAVQSSGGNFADPVGNIGDPFGLGDLLPPTELNFGQPEEREIIPGLVDVEPTVTIVTPDNPAGAINATSSVNEAGLPARGAEPAGSNASANSETVTGTIVAVATDGLQSVTINGVAVNQVGQVFTTPLGQLTITSITNGAIGYSYTLTDNSVAANPTDVFAVAVTDRDGDVATANLTINVIDDVPTARADTDALPAGGFGPETGNVLTGTGTTSGTAGADTPGADGATLNGIRAGTSGAFAAVGTGVSTIAGQYGTLTISANGNYSYTRNPGAPGGVNDVFGYQIVDGDGDVSTTTLTISIPDSPVTITSVPTMGDGTIVLESGLPARPGESPGSDQQSNSETTAGTITYNAPDAPATVAINGVTVTGPGQVITTPTGTLTITNVVPGQIDYSFTLTDNTQGDNNSQTFTITVTDADGDVATAPLVIQIVDDVPTARDDSSTAQEDKPVVINVFANDTPGADGVDLATKVVLATPPAKGTAVYNGDGTFTYTPTPGQEGSDSFTYTIIDGDGDPSTATVRITLGADSTPTIVAGDSVVDEAALSFGSNPGSNAETTTGALVFSGGGDSLASLTIGGVNVTNGGTVTGSYGTLTVTLSGGVYSYSYTLADNTSGDDTAENFAVVAVDSDGDVANDTLTIDIIDDVPTARDDTDSVPAASTVPETGNVMTGAGTTSGIAGADTQGADGAQVTSVSHGATTVAAGAAIAGDFGTLTLGSDGSYSYVRTPGSPSGVTEVFTYALTDGDGDVSTATLTFTIGDSTPSVSIPAPGGATTTVYEAALAARGAEPQGTGEEAAPGANGDTRETVSGTITFSSPDGIGTLSLGGTVLTPGSLPQTVASNATGTLVVTGFSYDPVSGAGSIAYSYTLTDNTLTDPSSASFALVLTDGDGDSAPAGNLVITIVDDAPIARPDVDSVSEDGPLVADGNVLTGVGGGTADSQGADGAGVVAVAFGANQGTLGNPLAGAYGDLVLTGSGGYTYTLDPSNPAVQTLAPGETLTEVYTYTLQDGDGDPAVTTLTIIINGADDGVTISGLDGAGAEEVVNEDDLFDGSSPDAPALTQTGTFSVTTPDGLDDVTVGGVAVVSNGVFTAKVIDTPAGALSITGFTPTVAPDGTITGGTFSYSYVLQDNLLTHPLQGEDSLIESFAVTLTDSDGSSDSASLDIRIIDDVPTAQNDLAAAAENTPVVINVLANDIRGADGVSDATGVALATAPGKGVAVYNGNGTFTYTAAPGAQGNDSFTYTITDGDGDTSTALVTITLPGDSEPIVSVTDLTVDEAGLSNGSNAAADSESDSGAFTISTGNDSIGKVEVQNAQGVWIDVTAGGSVQGDDGVLVVSVNAGVYSYVYTLTDNLPTHPDNIIDLDGDRGADDAIPGDSFAVRVTDNEGDVSPIDTIDVTVLDDGPTAVNDPAQSVVEGGAPIGGNVLTNDIQGADGATMTSVTIGGTTTAIAAVGTTPVVTANGSYSFTATGSWTFTPNANIANGGADADASFSYTLTDGDGDVSTANQPITISDGAGPSITDGAALQVDEEGLNTAGATGTSAGSGAAADSDTISFQAGSDAVTSVVFGDVAGITVDVNGVAGPDIVWTPTSATVITGSINGLDAITITLTPPALPVAAGASGQATVSVTLTDNFPHPDASGENVITLNGVSVVVSDLDGDSIPSTVQIEIVDDIPTVTAVVGGASVTLDETDAAVPGFPISQVSAAAVISGNLVFGADGPAAANATSYGLALTGNGTTALKTAVGDFAITLVQTDADTITGTYNGNTTAFTLSIGADGKLTVTQSVALEHNIDGSDAAAHNDPLDLTGLVMATVTIEDGDGDTASGQAAIGGLVTFLDDGPSIAVSVRGDADVVLTTEDAATIGPNSDVAVSVANFSGAFVQSSTTGADGGSAPVWGYQLAVTNTVSGLSSAGEPITLSMAGSTVEGRTASNGLIFSIGVDADGVVTLTQFQQIDHADEAPNSGAPFDDQFASLVAGSVTLTGTATITDNDGDTASDSETIDLGGNIRFADHGPTIGLVDAVTPLLSVDETVLGTNDTDSFAGIFGAQFGADGPAAGGGISYLLGALAGPSGLFDTATGEAVLLRVNPAGTLVEGYFGGGAGTVVFTLSVNPANGSVTLDQIRAVMHTPDTGVDQPVSLAPNLITLTATAEDFDGDTASTTVSIGNRIEFRDDAPTANAATSADSVDEDGLTNGLAGAQAGNPGDIAGEDVVATGSVSGLFNPGADGGLTYQLLSGTGGLPAHSSGGTPLVYTVAGNTLTATAGPAGPTVFTFTLTAGTGDWTFTLLRPLDHPNGNGENDIAIDFGSLVQATDKDGDAVAATGSVTVTIDDDSPVAANDTDAVVEDGPLVANGNVITGTGSDGLVGGADGLGADGAAVGGPVTAIAFGVTSGTLGTGLAGSYGTLTLNADGSYQYLLDNNNPAVQGLDATDPALNDIFTYTITDRDGDTSTATLTISITGANDGPVIGTDASTVSEEGLANGITDTIGTNDTTNSPIDTTGHVTVTDPDGDPVTLTLGDPGAVLTADGATVTWAGIGTKTLIGSVGPTEVIRIVIDDAGNYTVTLSQSVDHAVTGIETAGEDQRSFNVPVNASDGTVTNTNNGAITITIEDDSPDAVDDDVSATESGAVPDNLTGNVLTNDASGADTPTAVVSIAGGTLGNPLVGLHGTLTISASGGYSYVPNASVAAGAIDSFTYTMRDADGDTSTAVLRFTFTGDVNTPSAANVTASVDDDGIGGNATSTLGDLDANIGDADGPASSEASFSGNLGFNYGLDGAAGPATNFSFTTLSGSVGTESVSYAWNDAASTLTATITASSDAARIGQTLFTVLVNQATGDYTLTLARNVLHDSLDTLPGDNSENDATATLSYTVNDSDGSPANGSLAITFDDDMPTLTVSDTPTTAIEGGPAVNGTWSLAPGADGVTSVAVTFGGASGTLTLPAGANVVLVQPTGTLTVRADGTFSFLAATGQDNNPSPQASFTLTATDGDGDTSADSLTIAIQDGAPAGNAAPVTLLVDEAALSFGSNPGSTAETDNAPALSFTAGSDALTTFRFSTDLSNLVSNLDGAGTDLFWTRSGDGQAIVGSLTSGGPAAITLSLSAPASIAAGATGNVTVTVTLADNLPHQLALAAQTQSIGYAIVEALDNDGDVATGQVLVDVKDDVPTLTVSDTPTTAIEGGPAVNGTWSLTPGADGVASLAVTFGGASGTLTLPAGANVVLVQPTGTLTVRADGTFSFAAATGQDNDLSPQASFTLTATDSDGDTSADSLTIAIQDGAPAGNAAPVTLLVDEAALSFGSNPGSTAETDNAPALSFTAGSDALTTFRFSTDLSNLVANLDGAGTDLFWTRSGDGQTIVGSLTSGGPAAITLSLSAPASIAAGATGNVTVTVTLADNLPHQLALAAQTQSIGYAIVEALDNDGDVATGQVFVDVKDDVPVAAADVDSVTEDGPTTATGNVITGVDVAVSPDANGTDGVADVQGADGVTVTGVAAGTPVSASGNVGSGVAGTYGTLTLNANGSYGYVLNNASPLVQGLDTGETVTDTFTYSITDADGDVSTTTLTVTVNGANDAPVTLNSHTWMSSDPAQQTATTPAYANGYPVDVQLPTDVDIENLIVTATNAPVGVFYFNGASYVALAANTVLYNPNLGINLLDDLVYRPTATVNDVVTIPLNLSVTDGTATVNQVVTIHEVVPTRLPGQNVQVGDGSSPLTSGNDQVQSFTLNADFAAGLAGNVSIAVIDVFTDFQQQPNDVPIPVGERDPTVFGANNAGSHREQEVQAEVRIGTNRFVIVEDDLSAGTFEQSWFYDAASGLMRATVSYNNIYLLDGSGNATATTLAQFLTSNPAQAGDTWTVTYFDNDGGNYQARLVRFEFSYNDAGNPAINVQGDATLPDLIYGTSGNDILAGNGGDDTIIGRGGNDLINGGDGNDQLNGNDGDDVINGNNGNDTLNGGPGTDALDGGSGTNILVPPIVLDLDGDGVELVSRDAGVAFDYDGDGEAEATAWVGSDDGFLVYDGNGDRLVTSGSELVLTSHAAGATTDLEALSIAFDTNHDGLLSAADAEFGKFGVWQDANGNGVTDAGEFRTLAEAGIVSLSLTSDGVRYTAANGDAIVHGETHYTRSDGSTGIAADAAFATSAAAKEDQKAASAFANPGFGQALVAAGLVAAQAVSATPPNPPQPGTNASDGDTAIAGDAPQQSDAPARSAPGDAVFEIAPDDHQAADRSTPTHASHEADVTDAGRASTLGDDAAAEHVSASPAADTAQDAADAPSPAPVFVDMAPMPAIAAAGLAVAAATHGDAQKPALGEIVADALSGGSGPDIDALLANLPGGTGGQGNVVALFGGQPPEIAMPNWAGTGAHADPVAAAHEAVMAVSHVAAAH